MDSTAMNYNILATTDPDTDDPDQANAIMFADAFCMACHQQGFYPSPSDRVKRAEG